MMLESQQTKNIPQEIVTGTLQSYWRKRFRLGNYQAVLIKSFFCLLLINIPPSSVTRGKLERALKKVRFNIYVIMLCIQAYLSYNLYTFPGLLHQGSLLPGGSDIPWHRSFLTYAIGLCGNVGLGKLYPVRHRNKTMGQSCLNALHRLRETETEAALQVQLQRRALATSQDPGTAQRAISRRPKILKDIKRTEWVMWPHVGNLLGDRSSVRPDRSSVRRAASMLPIFQEWKMILQALCYFMPFPGFSLLDFFFCECC